MTDDSSTHLAQNLKRMREARGLSQASLAEHSGVPRPTIAHLESGQANPTLHVVLRVARALGISVDGLVDAGEAAVVIASPRQLPTKKSGRVKRVQVAGGAVFRDGEVERIVVREGGRFTITPEAAPEILVCERGVFHLEAGGLEVELEEEQVAIVRESCDVSSAPGGVIYRVSGRSS